MNEHRTVVNTKTSLMQTSLQLSLSRKSFIVAARRILSRI